MVTNHYLSAVIRQPTVVIYMKPGAPWSVKGIEPQARETAKSAARRAGMTLGEWLNHTILELGIDTSPTADPIRDPEDWMRETGEELPWTRPIKELSHEVTTRLAASEADNAALLSSIEVAIGGISKRLIRLDAEGTNQPDPELAKRLAGLETAQKRALSKDHLKTLETAVGQISVVLDNNAGRQNAVVQAQNERIDNSQHALEKITAHLEGTEERINQALSAVEAASDLYDITDKQGQMIDSLVMDVAAVQAEQKALENRSAEALASPRDEAKLAAAAIGAQISTHEERTAGSVRQIEEQITALSEALDQSLTVQQSGIEDLKTAFASVLTRVEALESIPPAAAPANEHIASEQKTGDESEAPVDTSQQTPVTMPVTFKTLQQQSSRNVNVNLAVSLGSDFTRTMSLPAEAPAEDTVAEEIILEAGDIEPGAETTSTNEMPPRSIEVVSEIVAGEDIPAETEPGPAETELEPIVVPENPLAGNDDVRFAEVIDAAIEEITAEAEALEDTPLTFADIFGDEPLGERPGTHRDPEEDAALKEAVSNISTVRASWAARGETDKHPGSIRQIVDIDSENGARHGWALTAGGMLVGLIAISGVLAYSGGSDDLVVAGERPGLFDQVATWLPGLRSNNGPAATPTSSQSPSAIIPAAHTNTMAFEIGLDEAASAGDAKAQFALARALTNGNGRTADKALAIKWYESAADQGLAIAQYVLGSLHERGIDVGQDKQTAIDWYASAARSGNRRSMHNLAVAYARGADIPQDLTLAAHWFSEAAKLGLSDAQYNLALLHERGLGVEKDLVTAYIWYTRAATGQDKAAMTQAARLGETLSADQKAAAGAAIASWKPRTLDPIANGLFDISPAAWDDGQKRASVAKTQNHLMTLGYALASSDGIMDPTTQGAIKDFQSSHNLEVTGSVSSGLIEVLSTTPAE